MLTLDEYQVGVLIRHLENLAINSETEEELKDVDHLAYTLGLEVEDEIIDY